MSKSKVYDMMKFIVILLVVFAHSSRMYTGGGVFSPICNSTGLAYITDFIYSFHMPVFMVVSGAVFGYNIEKGKYSSIKEFIFNKMKRLLIPYYAAGIFVVVPTLLALKISKQGWITAIFNNIILSRDPRHLWYILALFIIFLVCIPFRRIFLNKSFFAMILVLAITYGIHFFAFDFPPYVQLISAAQYIFWFVLGIYMNRYMDKIIKFSPKIVICICIISGGVLCANLFYGFGSLVPAIIGLIFMICVAILLLYTDIAECKIYEIVKKNVFGIYLFHPMLIYILYNFFYEKQIYPWILAPGISIVALILSLGIVSILKKLHLGIFIGEK